MALQKLDKKGHEIKELDYNVSAREFPKAPEAPKKEQFTQTKEYEQAVQTFERRNEEYARKVEELDRMKEEGGRIKTYVKVGQTEPELCYVEINRKETAPVTIGTLQERDKRFKQLSIEKTVADTKKDCPGERLSRKPVHAVRRRYGLFRHACPTSKETFPAFRHQGPAFRIGRETADENRCQTDGRTKDGNQTGLHQPLPL